MKLTQADYRPEERCIGHKCEGSCGGAIALWTVCRDNESGYAAAKRLNISRFLLTAWLCQSCYDALPTGEEGAA